MVEMAFEDWLALVHPPLEKQIESCVVLGFKDSVKYSNMNHGITNEEAWTHKTDECLKPGLRSIQEVDGSTIQIEL